PTPYPFTSEGLDACTEWSARIMWRMGGRPGDRVAVCLALSMHIGGVPACYAITYKMGACPIPIGAEAGTERILRFLKMFKADALVCTPSLAEYLIEKAPQIIGADVKSLGLKAILAGGEPGAGIPEIRQRIEEAYGCTLYDAGAGLGGSCGYPEYQGMHWVMDDYAFIELVDPETKEPIPLEDGAEGEAVLTSFKGSFTGTLRMSFGDIAQIFVSPCPCGQSGLRYKITGRIDDMMKIKGEMVYPSLIDAVISEFIPRVTGEFRIILNQPLPRIEPPLKLKVEYGEGVKEDQLEALANEIKERMHSRLKVTPQIIWVPPNSMERVVMKKKFFEKTYEKK
ncbi:MAG: phenylacetate--CoA ligase family protein, partial [Deferribacterota bacterium]|nr:phenylacetate--CoA ligase family protein [Deferribacterota bacterium]